MHIKLAHSLRVGMLPRLRLRWWHWLGVAVACIVAAQLAVPSDLLPLRAKLDGNRATVRRLSQLRLQLSKQTPQYTVSIGGKEVEVDTTQAGITTDADKTIAQINRLTLPEKIIPLGLVAHALSTADAKTVITVDQSKLASYADNLAKQHSYGPQDASATFVDGVLTVKDAKPGQTVTSDDIRAALSKATATVTSKLDVPISTVQPNIATDSFSAATQTYDKAKGKKLVIRYGDSTKEYSFADVSKWLEVVRSDDGNWRIQIKRSAFDEQSTEWGKQFNQPAGVTQVTLVDDVETSRVVGDTGRRIDEDKSYAALNAWLASPSESPQQLVSEVVYPRIAYTKTFTKSSATLQAKLNSWVSTHGGSYQIAVQELNGQGRTASYNVQQQTVMASTYKLFVAYAVYHQAENGALSLNTVLSTGQTIETCISKAIINSDNDCAIALGRYIGWSSADNIVHAAGFQNVFLNNYDASGNVSGDKKVNANELARFLTQLSAGSLMNSSHTTSLLSYMKQQVYRSGIPSGSHGAVVADKVGFLDGYLHDAAIVYAPNTTYALVIMSSSSSWSNISSLADAVYTFMAE